MKKFISIISKRCQGVLWRKNIYEVDYEVFLPNGESIICTEIVEARKAPKIQLRSHKGTNYLHIGGRLIESTTIPIILLDTKKIK